MLSYSREQHPPERKKPQRSRPSGIEIIGPVPWGVHISLFYETAEDLASILVPYFQAGLLSNESCLWITSPPLETEKAKAALRAAVPDLDRRIAAGQIEILDHGEWYAPEGAFDPGRTLRGWAKKLDEALALGFEGLRISGNTSWLDAASWDDFMKYEQAVSDLIGRLEMLAICAYPVAKCGPRQIFDVLAHHRVALAKRSGNLEIIGRGQRGKAPGSGPECGERYPFEKEMEEMRLAEEALLKSNKALARRVGERTAELAISDERLRIALRIANIQVADFDLELRHRWIFAPGSVFDHDKMTGRRFDEVIPGPNSERFVEFQRKAIETGKGSRAEMAFDAPDGGRRVFDVITEPLRDDDEAITGLLTAMMDVTDHRRMEAHFFQAQKMEAIGRLAGGVAHDFNNMMQVILGFAARLLKDIAPVDPLRSDAEGIRKTAGKAAELTRKLLALGRKQVLKPEVLDLNVLVSEAVPVLRRTLGEDIEILTILKPVIGRVRADPGSIEQVLLNLALNARDAMPHGGTMVIETNDVEIVQPSSMDEPDIVPGSYVRLSVSDTGTGMDDEIMARLFEPFFTTKPDGRGTGLGLATAYGTIRQSDGILRVYSEPGEGTLFEISLPRVDGVLAPRSEAPASAPSSRGDETILLVEDDEDVRDLMIMEISDLGYRVIAARDYGDAMQKSRDYTGTIHMLLTDVILPGPSGRVVSESMTDERPGIRTLYVSGHTESHIVRRGILIPGTHFLQKPFTTEQLAPKIRETLAER